MEISYELGFNDELTLVFNENPGKRKLEGEMRVRKEEGRFPEIFVGDEEIYRWIIDWFGNRECQDNYRL